MITRDYYKELQDIDELPLKGSVLDLGCGDGRFSRPFNEAGFNCVLVDSDSVMLSHAVFSLKKNNESHKKDLNEFLENCNQKFDVVIANNILPFLGGEDFKKAMVGISKVLKKGGIFIGVFFGERDEWNNSHNKKIYFHSREQSLKELSKYELVNFQEIDAKLGLLIGGSKLWHRFEFIAKKR